MGRQVASLILLSVGSLGIPVIAQSAMIDVMVVFEQTAFAASSSRSQVANEITAIANEALQRSGLAHGYNLVYWHPTPLNFASSPGIRDEQVRQAMVADPEIPQLRNQYSADLVVLVSEYLHLDSNGADHCGVSWAFLQEVPKETNRDSTFRAAIKRACILTDNQNARTTSAHELGHLSHLDHQLVVQPNPDTVVSTPVTYNHPFYIATVNQNLATMMVAGPTVCAPQTCTIENVHSDPQGTFAGTSTVRGHPYDRDDKRMIYEAFPVIARYKNPQPAQVTVSPPICSVTFGQCINYRQSYLPSWEHNTSSPIPPFSVFDADYSDNNGSTWKDLISTSGQGCVPTTPPTQGRTVRVRITSSYGNSSYCQVFLSFRSCEDTP